MKVWAKGPRKRETPQPSACGPVRPPLSTKPLKEKAMSMGALAVIPRSSHTTGTLAHQEARHPAARRDVGQRRRRHPHHRPHRAPQEHEGIAIEAQLLPDQGPGSLEGGE